MAARPKRKARAKPKPRPAKRPLIKRRRIKGRLHKAALARAVGIHRTNLDKYLNQSGAPEPDDAKTYDVKAVFDFIADNSSKAEPSSLNEFKKEEIRLRCEKLRDDLERSRGEYISKKEAAQTLVPLMAELRELLRMKFILELPSRYRGKDPIECAQINEAAVDLVIDRFRSGTKTITESAAAV